MDCDGVMSVDDCDDQDATSTYVGIDADCDRTPAAYDCDDSDSSSTIRADDEDCDGIPTAVDCNDDDVSVTVLATDPRCGFPATTLSLPEGAYASFPSVPEAVLRGAFCIEAWVKLDGSGHAVIASSYDTPQSGTFILQYSPSGEWLQFAQDRGGSFIETIAFGSLHDGIWHHVAACRAVSGTTHTLTIWKDGIQAASKSGLSSTMGSYHMLKVGATGFSADGLHGQMSQIRVSSLVRYTSTFTPPERLQVEPSTVGLWWLNDGEGTILHDRVSASNSASHVGGVWMPP
jgi:hypothetical protein